MICNRICNRCARLALGQLHKSLFDSYKPFIHKYLQIIRSYSMNDDNKKSDSCFKPSILLTILGVLFLFEYLWAHFTVVDTDIVD